VGHVAPALAVAEALRDRGVTVTFAGSPDRVEARLVPERGYAFDAFPVAGFPRRPGVALLRALALAAAAPAACGRILARRRPDVVLGAGGYVAGPMVFAAWLRRVPAAVTEADAHLGLANRLARRSRVACCLRIRFRAGTARSTASSGARFRRRRSRLRATMRAAASSFRWKVLSCSWPAAASERAH
jgi:UDP-N-acetylglucosamine--N-acetylmuramyl-(pentapeptide) pyrophosphoryl-undecaprenol N-acetylglucosamine transferase